MRDIDFAKIAPRLSGKNEAFEELCCQLFRRHSGQKHSFVRLNGAGGDGGVECYVDETNGSRVGLQAKYVFDIDPLLTQLTTSLATALNIHPALNKFIVCFPFNLAGLTGRGGKSQLEKFNAWRQREVDDAVSKGMNLTIEDWSASKILDELLTHDASGGMSEFFFNETCLSEAWFQKNLDQAKAIAGPRYSSELSVDAPLWKVFAAFARHSDTASTFHGLHTACMGPLERLVQAVERSTESTSHLSDAWPESLKDHGKACAESLRQSFDQAHELMEHVETSSQADLVAATRAVDQALDQLSDLEFELADDLEERYGKGMADSEGFRQHMAEYQVSLPAANLDNTRKLRSVGDKFHEWLNSAECHLQFESSFVLTGAAGVGKTHSICDAATHRLANKQFSTIVFGHQFGGEPEFWSRFREILALPSQLTRDGLLDALNSKGEASGSPLIIFIDAINETKPPRYWKDRLVAVADLVKEYDFLRLCVSCRNAFEPFCLPANAFFHVPHHGFRGMEREACSAFFQHYGLKPPVAPILQQELSNPLFLKIACSTARSLKLTTLPTGWFALNSVLKAFLDEKEREFAEEFGVSVGAASISGALSSLADKIAHDETTSITWSDANQTVKQVKPITQDLPVIQWLVNNELLIEEPPLDAGGFGEENTLRIAFDRLNDFLIAAILLDDAEEDDLRAKFGVNGSLGRVFSSVSVVDQNQGVVSALSLIIPEQLALGTELPEYLEDDEVQIEVLRITLENLSSRRAASFSAATEEIVMKGLGVSEFAFATMDSVLAVAWQTSSIDAYWIDGLLRQKKLAERDAFWCGYLHHSYDEGRTVKRLIDAAFELDSSELELEVARRWLLLLIWFTAAADRRIKDFATRSATALLISFPELTLDLLQRFVNCDDDAIRERVLLAIYGSFLLNRNKDALHATVERLLELVETKPREIDNAVLRDHIRCICDFAIYLGVTEETPALDRVGSRSDSEWPLVIPTADAIGSWKSLPGIAHSCMNDDFYVYTMSCLHAWESSFPRDQMARWIVARVAEHLGYAASRCDGYDKYMISKFGPGRGRRM